MKRANINIPRSDYITLPFSSQKLESSRKLEYWLGYRRRVFDPCQISDEKLIDFATLSLETPRRRVIPAEISEAYHKIGLYFKIYEELWKLVNSSFCLGKSEWQRVKFPELLYSEPYVEITEEVRRRKLVDKVREKREDSGHRRGRKLFMLSLEDKVPSPVEELIFDKLREMSELLNRHPKPDMIVGSAGLSPAFSVA